MIWEARLQNASPRGAGRALYISANPIVMQYPGECFKKYQTLKNYK